MNDKQSYQFHFQNKKFQLKQITRYQIKLQIDLCSFIPQYKNIKTYHYLEYIVRPQKKTTNSDEKHRNSSKFCSFENVVIAIKTKVSCKKIINNELTVH